VVIRVFGMTEEAIKKRSAVTLSALRAAADPMRMRMLVLLAEEDLTVAELQEILGMGQSRISAGLALLKREGLAADRRAGKNIFYSARGRVPTALLEVVRGAAAAEDGTEGDAAALAHVLAKRKDRAAAYFDRLAGRFGRTYIPGRSWQALAHGLLALLPPVEIADLGAGEGTLSQLLARNARRVIAVDNSPKMVEFAAATARANGFRNLEFRLGDIEDPPVDDESVDLALFSQALHHAVNPRRAIDSAFRILRPGGRILILDLAKHSHEEARELYAHEWLGFSEAGLIAMLGAAGFADTHAGIVAREKQAPHFQTLLAVGTKPRP